MQIDMRKVFLRCEIFGEFSNFPVWRKLLCNLETNLKNWQLRKSEEGLNYSWNVGLQNMGRKKKSLAQEVSEERYFGM